MGWLTDLMGMGNANEAMAGMNPSNWAFRASQASVNPNDYLSNAMANLKTSGQNWNTQANQFFDPNSQFYQNQSRLLRENVGSGVGMLNRNLNQTLASRGVGGGGIRSLLNAMNANKIGEQVRFGSNDMYKLGLGTGTNLANTSINAFGQLGNLGAGREQRQSDLSRFNTGQLNEAKRFNAQNIKDYNQMQYSNAAAQDANNAALWGSAFGLVGDVIGLNPFGWGGE